MECSKVSHLLSEFVDDRLDPTSRRLVEEHVASCENCAAELESLRAYLRAMAAMERISAPQGFLSAVHQRIEQPSTFRKITRWLFYPLKIKLPMELAGIAVATLLLLFAYQQPPRQEKEKDLSALSRQVRQPIVSADGKGTSLGQTAAERSVAAPRHIRLALSFRPPEVVENATKPYAVAAPPSAPAKAKTETERTEPDAKKQSASPSIVTKPSIPSAPVTRAREEKSPAPRSPGQVYAMINESAVSLGGLVLSSDYDKATNEPNTIVVRLPASAYSQFLEKLSRTGQIKESIQDAAEAGKAPEESGLLEVRIDLVRQE